MERDELYVGAAKVSGVSDWHIIARHILWVGARPPSSKPRCHRHRYRSSIGREFLGLGDPSTGGGMLQETFTKSYTTLLAGDKSEVEFRHEYRERGGLRPVVQLRRPGPIPVLRARTDDVRRCGTGGRRRGARYGTVRHPGRGIRHG
tara:strand:- start:221 stop:661 length:441 start_codon:yes stop_codon:yes gene_type:complete